MRIEIDAARHRDMGRSREIQIDSDRHGSIWIRMDLCGSIQIDIEIFIDIERERKRYCSYPVSVRWRAARPAEGQQLLGYDPVQVAVFDSLVVLVVFQVKGFHIEPLQFHAVL